MTRPVLFLSALAVFFLTAVTSLQAAPKKPQEFRVRPPLSPKQYNTKYKENDAGLEKHNMLVVKGISSGIRSYYSYTPQNLTAGGKAPAVILLHGAGRTGVSMGDMWRKNAERHGIKLFAPNGLGRGWFQDSDNAMIPKLIEKIRSDKSIDPARIYLFGHSDGATAALTHAALNSATLAGVGIHAGAIRDESHLAAIKTAQRKIPYCIFTGTYDAIFPLETVRHSARLIAYEGHDTVFTELAGHNHWYYTIADWINEGAWSCMTGLTKK